MQDDSLPPLPSADLTWLAHTILLFSRWPEHVGSVGMSMGLFFVARYDRRIAHDRQTLHDLPEARDQLPACNASARGTWAALDGQPSRDFVGTHSPLVAPTIRVEAMRCADFGPLFMRTDLFRRIGGFNESGTARGEPSSSFSDDCEEVCETGP